MKTLGLMIAKEVSDLGSSESMEAMGFKWFSKNLIHQFDKIAENIEHIGQTEVIIGKYVTCSALWGLLDYDVDLRAAGHVLLNTERIL